MKSFAASVMSIKPQLTKEGWGEGERERGKTRLTVVEVQTGIEPRHDAR